MKQIQIILFVLLILLTFGCKSKREGTTGKLKKRSTKYIQNKMEKYHLDAEWMSAKANVKVTDAKGSISGTAIIRMRKDSVIWASVRKLGIEAGRALITTDSVYIMNRLQRQYSVESFDYIRKLTGLPSSGNNLEDFRMMYDFLLGNPVIPKGTILTSSIEEDKYKLQEDTRESLTDYWINGKDFTLQKMKFFNKTNGKEGACTYSQYQALESKLLFPYTRNVKAYSRTTGKVELDLKFGKVVLNEAKTIKFEIPSSYKRTN
ncbi:MAG: DUF4292 domain-containing protein [Saprospiraceae bacterium]